jgi:16S rRNA (cytidine1402-2'-O)-methyltransferase
MLYLVATPIGNLGDITQRALDTLREADVVVSEDTRKTGFLLTHFDIHKPQLSFREDNEERTLPKVLALLQEDKKVALVTDAGTPGISDPGFILVRAALEADIPVNAIPGPTAFVMALVLSGLPVYSFTFRGFPPHKPTARLHFLEADQDSPYTLIYYESPYRLKAFLQAALTVFGDRRAAIANDLTKHFEQVERGTLAELAARYETATPKGEYTVVIEGEA